MRVFFLLSCLTALLCSVAVADDDAAWGTEAYQFPSPFKPYFSLATGLSVRLDDRENSDELPTLHLRLHYYGRPAVAPFIGVGYTLSSDWGGRREFTGFEYEFGIRFRDVGRFLSLQLDPALSFMRYSGRKDWAGLTETKTGFSISAGIGLHLTKTVTANVAIRQIVNDLGDHSGVVFPNSPGFTPPPPEGWYGVVPPYFYENIFNPTSIDVQLEFRL